MEVTKWLKPSVSVSRIGDSASVQAVTRVKTGTVGMVELERTGGVTAGGRPIGAHNRATAQPFAGSSRQPDAPHLPQVTAPDGRVNWD
jgi:hypothetical protein